MKPISHFLYNYESLTHMLSLHICFLLALLLSTAILDTLPQCFITKSDPDCNPTNSVDSFRASEVAGTIQVSRRLEDQAVLLEAFVVAEKLCSQDVAGFCLYDSSESNRRNESRASRSIRPGCVNWA